MEYEIRFIGKWPAMKYHPMHLTITRLTSSWLSFILKHSKYTYCFSSLTPSLMTSFCARNPNFSTVREVLGSWGFSFFRRIAVGTRSKTLFKGTLNTRSSPGDREYAKEQNVVPKSIAAILGHLPAPCMGIYCDSCSRFERFCHYETHFTILFTFTACSMQTVEVFIIMGGCYAGII